MHQHRKTIITYGDTFRIATPPLNYTGLVCVEFGYNVYGEQMGELSIFSQEEVSGNISSIWNTLNNRGGQQDRWLTEELQGHLADDTSMVNKRVLIHRKGTTTTTTKSAYLKILTWLIS